MMHQQLCHSKSPKTLKKLQYKMDLFSVVLYTVGRKLWLSGKCELLCNTNMGSV